MDKIFTDNQSSSQKSSIDTRCENKKDIEEFDYVLKKKAEEERSNDSDKCTLEAEIHIPYGLAKTELVLEKESDDQKISISSLPVDSVTCNDNDFNCTNRGDRTFRANNVRSINELAKIVDSILSNTISNKENKWKFTYMDSSLGMLNMSVNKVSQNHISVIISSLHINNNYFKRISHQLHSRLLHRGWDSQISQESNASTNNHKNNEREK